MKGLLCRAGVVGLLALVSQGCLVPWGKHVALKNKYNEAVQELAAKDSQLADATTRIDALKDQLNAANHLIGLYKDKGDEASRIAREAKDKYADIERRLRETLEKFPGAGEYVGGGKVLIKDQLLFPLGSSEVSEKGKQLLEDIAKQFKGTGEEIQIDGHTDNVRLAKPETIRRYEDNWGLAAWRAKAVLKLLAQFGIEDPRMHLRAFSMYRPLSDNNTGDNRARNRRVEVTFFPLTKAAKEEKPAAEEPKKEEKKEAKPATP
jgi:flagellar motor protein MotB